MKTYCLIGRREGDIKHSMIDHGPLSAESATAKRRALQLPSCTIASYERAAHILQALNKGPERGKSFDDVDAELVQTEQIISGAIKQYLLLSSQLGKKVEIFVGHENNEVELTCKP